MPTTRRSRKIKISPAVTKKIPATLRSMAKTMEIRKKRPRRSGGGLKLSDFVYTPDPQMQGILDKIGDAAVSQAKAKGRNMAKNAGSSVSSFLLEMML